MRVCVSNFTMSAQNKWLAYDAYTVIELCTKKRALHTLVENIM